MNLLNVVYEDERLLALNKPAGLPCHPTKRGPLSSLAGRLRLRFGEGVPLHFINRLDRETSGLTLLAKDREAARELRSLWAARKAEKEYLALVHGKPKKPEGLIDVPIGPDESSPVAVKDKVRPDGAAALTRYRLLRLISRAEGDFALLAVRPVTGRKHQIRIHLAHIGCPVAGDKLYGADPEAYLAFVQGRLTAAQRRRLILPNHALHAWKLAFLFQGARFLLTCPPERPFLDFLRGQPIQTRAEEFLPLPPKEAGGLSGGR